MADALLCDPVAHASVAAPLRIIQESASALLAIVNDILDSAKMFLNIIEIQPTVRVAVRRAKAVWAGDGRAWLRRPGTDDSPVWHMPRRAQDVGLRKCTVNASRRILSQ